MQDVNLKSEESIFVDDNINNVVTTHNMGINVYQFNGKIDE